MTCYAIVDYKGQIMTEIMDLVLVKEPIQIPYIFRTIEEAQRYLKICGKAEICEPSDLRIREVVLKISKNDWVERNR